MPFLPAQNNMLAPVTSFSTGPTSGFGENFSAAFDRQMHIDALFGLEADLSDEFGKTMERYSELTGEAAPSFPLSVLGAAARRASGQQPETFWTRPLFSEEGTPDPALRRQLEQFDKINKRLAELKETDPEVKTFSDILADVQTRAKEIEKRDMEIGGRAGVSGTVGGFLGAMVGSFSWRDPLNIATLGIGGAGRSLAMRLLTEGGANAAVESFNQFAGVQGNQEILGVGHTNPWVSIAAAAVGAAGIRGAVEGAVPAYRAVERQLFPQRAQARVIRDAIEGNLGRPIEGLMARSGLTDEQLASFLREMPQTADVRAASAALEKDMELRDANPYGASREAEILFERDIETLLRAMDGAPSRQDLLASTTLGRSIPQQAADQEVAPDVLQNLARSRAPDVYKRLDDAETRLRAADEAIATLRGDLDNRSMADSIRLLDEASSERVAEIEQEMAQAIPRARRDVLERELDTIAETLGPDAIARAENDYQIKPRKELKRAEKARKAARRDQRRAQAEAEAVQREVLTEMEARNRLARAMSRRQVNQLATDLKSAQESLNRADLTPRPSRGELDQIQSATEIMAERQDEFSKAAVDRARATPDPEEGGERLVDIGADRLVPDTMEVVVGIGEDGEPTMMSVREILDDLADDDAMIEAMKVCAI